MAGSIPCERPCQKSGKARANLPGCARQDGEPAARAGRPFHSLAAFVLVALLPGGCTSVPTAFHPNPAIPPSAFSHAPWDRALRAHVVDGEVNYPALAKDKAFAEYLASLNHVDPEALPTREDRLAFWINAYNALAAKGIIDGYSPTSLWGKYRYFIGHDHEIGGAELNLYDLEHQILIPTFSEPRVHFAIVCASRSCPKLQSAYDPADLDRQLDEAARMFLNDSTRNRFDRDQGVAHLSMIFNWFMEDFIAHSGSVIQYIKPYLEDPVLVKDLELRPYRVEFLEYDWRLNGVPPTKE